MENQRQVNFQKQINQIQTKIANKVGTLCLLACTSSIAIAQPVDFTYEYGGKQYTGKYDLETNKGEAIYEGTKYEIDNNKSKAQCGEKSEANKGCRMAYIIVRGAAVQLDNERATKRLEEATKRLEEAKERFVEVGEELLREHNKNKTKQAIDTISEVK